MKKKAIKYLAASLAVLGCISSIPQRIVAKDTHPSISCIQTNIEDLSVANKDKEKDTDNEKDKLNGSGIFSDENSKYLSSEQKKQLKEIKKCKDSGKKLSAEQEKTLHSIVDCVIKGKLGDEKYKDFKCLMEKKNKGTKLTDEENKKLKEYKKILHGCEDCSNNEVLRQFLR